MSPLLPYRILPWVDSISGMLSSGRLLVRMKPGADWLDCCNWEGSRLPAALLYGVFQIALGERWAEELEALHCGRDRRWQAEVSSGQDKREYRVHTITDAGAGCSSIITIAGGQVETFSIRAEDGAPLLSKIFGEHTPAFVPRYRNNRLFPNFYPYPADHKYLEMPVIIRERRDALGLIPDSGDICAHQWQLPGGTSGLIETIQALKCMEVLLA